jgi:hypothetical protein
MFNENSNFESSYYVILSSFLQLPLSEVAIFSPTPCLETPITCETFVFDVIKVHIGTGYSSGTTQETDHFELLILRLNSKL